MSKLYLQLDDLRTLNSPDNIATIFRRLGYNAQSQLLDVSDLNISSRNSETTLCNHAVPPLAITQWRAIALMERKCTHWTKTN